ncbi:MAG: hypothetical protein U0Y68_06040 [Blastocatellia bacterium]
MPSKYFFSDLAALEQQINQLFEGTRLTDQPSHNSGHQRWTLRERPVISY